MILIAEKCVYKQQSPSELATHKALKKLTRSMRENVGSVAEWLRHPTGNLETPGSIPGLMQHFHSFP